MTFKQFKDSLHLLCRIGDFSKRKDFIKKYGWTKQKKTKKQKQGENRMKQSSSGTSLSFKKYMQLCSTVSHWIQNEGIRQTEVRLSTQKHIQRQGYQECTTWPAHKVHQKSTKSWHYSSPQSNKVGLFNSVIMLPYN